MVIKLLEKHQQAKSFSFQKIWRCKLIIGLIVILMAIVGTVYFIPWRTVLLVEETGVPGENHLPAASH
jgi:hypothetical protein